MKYQVKEHKLVVGASARAGNTSVNKLLGAMFYPDDKMANKYMLIWDIYPEARKIITDDNGWMKIKVVRNSYSRVISSFIFPGWKQVGTFIDFLKCLKKIDLRLCDQHYMLQVEKFEDKYDMVFNIEDINKMGEFLSEKYNIPTQIMNRRNVRTKDDAIFVDDVIYGNYREAISKHKNDVPSHESFINKEVIQLIEEIYKEDIETYNFENPFKHLI